MKYDSGMKQFHKDILAALQYMLKDDKEIAEKFSPKDGSPAPMRDYLKQKYGKSRASHIGDGIRYCCNFSKGLELTFDTILNNPGDKNLTLSWSQTAKFIRDNWDEVFKKDKPKSCPIETLVRTFDEAEITCPNWMLGKTLTYLEAVNGIHFECKAFSMEFCKFDDITNFFVQHCYKPQECPYCKDSAKSKPTYKDIFLEHYPDFDVSRFDEFAESLCVACCFDDGGAACPFPGNDECKTHWESECLFKWRDRMEEYDLEILNEFLIEQPSESEAEESHADTENQIIPQNAGEISETFNYAVLSVEMGDYLKRKEQQLKNEYMNFTANCGAIFAEVQEKLAKDGHGTFIKWIEAMGFKKDTVYRMIDVNKFRLSLIAKDENGTQEIFDALPKYLQYDISKPSAPAELVEQVLNGDIITHKDYIALKKQLEYTKAACDHANKRRDENYSQYQDEHRKNAELEKRVKELESRPIDVAVQQDETSLAEIGRLKNELAKAQQEILNASFGSSTADSELLTDLYETLHGSALSAIRSCADFAEKNGGKFTSRFRSLAEVINDYLNEMEEF